MSTHASNAFIWNEAGAADDAAVLVLMGAFYSEERLAFDPEAARSAVKTLAAKPELGRIFLLKAAETTGVGKEANGASAEGAEVCGHLVLTWGFSLEFHGRYVLLDELYVLPALRGNGWGRSGIEFAAAWACEHGAASLRLEVNHGNRRAKEVYLRNGFRDDRRDLMTRWMPVEK